jgi:hypothetical protein
VTLNFVEVKPEDQEANSQVTHLNLVRLALFGQRLAKRKQNKLKQAVGKLVKDLRIHIKLLLTGEFL